MNMVKKKKKYLDIESEEIEVNVEYLTSNKI